MGSFAESSEHADLSVAETAQVLNVSDAFVIRLVETGKLRPYIDGGEERLKLADVVVYRDRAAARAETALSAMTAQAEELGLYDEQG